MTKICILQDLQQSINDLKGIMNYVEQGSYEKDLIKAQARAVSLNIKEYLDELIEVL